MAHKKDIASNLQKVLTKEELKYKSGVELNRANDLYNKLLRDGVIQKKGNTLRTPGEDHLFRVKLNGR